jgi:hypothetical protein
VFNAKTGERIKTSVGPVISDDNDGDSLPADFSVQVTFEQARAIAQAKFPAGTINKIELDVENGIVVISVRFADKARVDVDATTGTIVRSKDPKGVDAKQVKTDDKKVEDNSASLNKTDGVERTEQPDAPDTDDNRDIEAADDDAPDQPDAPDAADATDGSDSSGSDSGSGSSGSGSSGSRG